MHIKTNDRKLLIYASLLAGLLFLGASYYIHTKQVEYVSMMKLNIAKQEKTLATLSEITDRNGADAAVAEIIKDCDLEDRQEFDELLSRLGELNNNQLRRLDLLFDACGYFYAQRKALMTARLEREFEVYNDYVSLLNIVDSKEKKISYPVEKWGELVDLEKQRSSLSSDLVLIQKNIISALLNNVSVKSEEMKEQLTHAQEINDSLSLVGTKIDTLREELIDL